jgi:hypothetical protein
VLGDGVDVGVGVVVGAGVALDADVVGGVLVEAAGVCGFVPPHPTAKESRRAASNPAPIDFDKWEFRYFGK